MASKSSAAVTEARRAGRLGLTVYVIPGFPSVDAYRATQRELEALEYVSVIETTAPVTADFSPNANEFIRSAHKRAAKNIEGHSLADLMKSTKVTFGILYEQSVKRAGMGALLDEAGGEMEGVLLEWREEDPSQMYADACERGVEWITGSKATSSAEDLAQRLERAEDDGYHYLVGASKTGGELPSVETLRTAAQNLKKLRPELSISVGFGVATSADVESIADVHEIDGVVVGTAYLRAAENGPRAAVDYLSSISEALRRRG